MFPGIPVVRKRPELILYGPLAESKHPDVILTRMGGVALMTLSDAIMDLAIEGKPQCESSYGEGTAASGLECRLRGQ